ncbi:MAG: hypothetical protein KAR19_03305 [Bacteroidales bacterium]|nr:hypothetical protein [Bacteroidales bacterium]
MKIIIRFATYQVEAELYDTPTGQAIYNALPLQRNVNTWGDEIYFEIPVKTTLEADAKSAMSVGDLAYWPNMPAFCIIFGPTPASTGDTPEAASPVNVIGKLSEVDLKNLRRVPDGENVTVEKAG